MSIAVKIRRTDGAWVVLPERFRDAASAERFAAWNYSESIYTIIVGA